MHAHLLVSPHDVSIKKVRELFPEIKLVLTHNVEKIKDTAELIRDTNIAALENTAYLLPDFDKASVEAQNALLKRLEEPQENITFVLTAKNETQVLPTILSRCNVITLSTQESSLVDEKEYLTFCESSVGNRFTIISKITKREDAKMFLENLIKVLHNKLSDEPKYQKILKKASETLDRIDRNGNPTLQLTEFAVSTPSV